MRRTALIVDDHATFRYWARQFLEAEGYEVVGEAEDAASAFSAAQHLLPDLILLDVQLPDASGFELADILAEQGSRSRVVLTSARDGASYGDRLARCGAVGFLTKEQLSGPALREILPW